MKVNKMYLGDCTELLKDHPANTIDLIYIDPPFYSNRNYEHFDDRWTTIDDYLSWMNPIIQNSHRMLKDTGSLYLHCDYHANAHLRVLTDQIFNPDQFINEIIWYYGERQLPNIKKYNAKHDTILFYVKNKNHHTFNMQFMAQTQSYTEQFFKYVDEYGNRYQKRKKSKTYPNGRQYLNSNPGVAMDTVWIDIKPIHSRASKENISYPTQKPERLLERIIKTSSNPNDIVLDPMCGSGTTLAVAQRLNRRWIGIDISPIACEISRKRLEQQRFAF